MTSYDNLSGSEQDADSHEDNSHNYMKMAGEVKPVNFSANGGNYQNNGPSASNPVEQVLRILASPRTGNVLSIKTGNTIR